MSEMATTSAPPACPPHLNMDRGAAATLMSTTMAKFWYAAGQRCEGPALPISALVRQLQAAGYATGAGALSDILHDRVEQLCGAHAMQDVDYQGGYTAVYPIKVNQQRRVVEEILATSERGNGRVGLEAGSKPELLAVLALSDGGSSLIVCNGYKDREYVRLALLGEKLGHKVDLVVEKLSVLELILEEARELDVTPRIGLRARLASVGKGKWQNTGGEKSKFGLTASQILEVVDTLRAQDALAACSSCTPSRLADRQHSRYSARPAGVRALLSKPDEPGRTHRHRRCGRR